MNARIIDWRAEYDARGADDERATDPGAAPRRTRGPRVARWRPYVVVAGDGVPLVGRVTAWTWRPPVAPRGGARGAAHYLARRARPAPSALDTVGAAAAWIVTVAGIAAGLAWIVAGVA